MFQDFKPKLIPLKYLIIIVPIIIIFGIVETYFDYTSKQSEGKRIIRESTIKAIDSEVVEQYDIKQRHITYYFKSSNSFKHCCYHIRLDIN
jgi:hypothetical protein